MKTSIIISALFAMIFQFSIIEAQTIEIQSNCRGKIMHELVPSSKSKVVSLKEGQNYSMNFTIKKGKTYLFAVDGAKSLGNVQFRIKGIDESGNEVIVYDNSLDEFKEKVVFKSGCTGQAVLEIITQPNTDFTTKSIKDEVGILLAYN